MDWVDILIIFFILIEIVLIWYNKITKLNIKDIIKDSFEILKTNKKSESIFIKSEIVVIFIIPLFISLLLAFRYKLLNADANGLINMENMNLMIGVFSIFTGFLVNLLAIVLEKFVYIKSENDTKQEIVGKTKIAKNLYRALMLSTVNSILIIIVSTFTIIIKPNNAVLFTIISACMYYLIIVFFLFLLMVIKYFHSLYIDR